MIAAMDVGGTNIRYKVLDDEGQLIASDSMSTQSIGLIEAIESIILRHPVEKIGISYAGQVNNGVILSAPNIKVDEPNIQAYFLERHQVRLYIENDLKCAALAEYRHWGCSTTMVAASVGTGFGSAIIENGKLFSGSHNLAGEVGHMPYKYSEVACGCGNHYCVEAFCSGSALTRWIRHYDLPVERDTIDALRVLKDKRADQVLSDLEDGLLFAIGSLISITNPETIVLGGGVIHKNPYLLDFVNDHIDKYALAIARRQTRIILSELEDAPLKGAEILIDYHSKD